MPVSWLGSAPMVYCMATPVVPCFSYESFFFCFFPRQALFLASELRPSKPLSLSLAKGALQRDNASPVRTLSVPSKQESAWPINHDGYQSRWGWRSSTSFIFQLTPMKQVSQSPGKAGHVTSWVLFCKAGQQARRMRPGCPSIDSRQSFERPTAAFDVPSDSHTTR